MLPVFIYKVPRLFAPGFQIAENPVVLFNRSPHTARPNSHGHASPSKFKSRFRIPRKDVDLQQHSCSKTTENANNMLTERGARGEAGSAKLEENMRVDKK